MPRSSSVVSSLVVLVVIASGAHVMTPHASAQSRRSSRYQPSYADVGTPAPTRPVGSAYGTATVLVRTGEHHVSSEGVDLEPTRDGQLPVRLPRASFSVHAEGRRPRLLQLTLEAGDEVAFFSVSRTGGRAGAIATLALGGLASLGASLGIGLTASCTPSAFGGADCARPVSSAIFGAGAGVFAMVAGFLLLAQPDLIEAEVRSARGMRRELPHARGLSISSGILLGVHVTLTLAVLPYIALQEPTSVLEQPWDALLPGMAAMLAIPAFVGLAGDLAGARGELWAAYVGSLAGWLGLALGQILIEELNTSSSPTTGLPAMITGTGAALIGAVIGYAISDHDDERPEGDAVLPTFAVMPNGATLGVVGTL